MPPSLVTLISRNSSFDPTATSGGVRDQWVHPGDVFTVLLILGGDVVGRALAQLAGDGLTPVAFSFGMVKFLLACTLGYLHANSISK
jgi:hypothetical protein